MIEASPTDAGTAYIAVERHRMDDFAPYAFKTNDFGKTWTAITKGIPPDVYIHAVRVDPKRKGLLYAGTESGVYISFDDGANWQPLQLNLPVAPVNDLIVKNDDLAVATHGRSFWVLDDLAPLRHWQDSIRNNDVHLFTPSAANHTTFPPSFFGGGNAGSNPPPGAVIYYFLKNEIKKPEPKKEGAAGDQSVTPPATNAPAPSATTATNPPAATAGSSAQAQNAEKKPDEQKPTDRVKVEVLDASGKVIRTYPPKRPAGADGGDEGFGATPPPTPIPTEAGINRFVWDLRYEGAERIPNSPLWGGSTEGPTALPGKYQVRLTVDGKSQTQPLEIAPDPRLKVTEEDLKKQFDLMQAILGKVTQVHDAVKQIRDVRAQINTLNKRLTQEKFGNAKAIADAGSALDKKMTAVEEQLIATKARSGQDVLNYPIRLNNLLVALGGTVSSADAAPTKQEYELFDELSKQADEQLGQWNNIVKTDLAQFNTLVRQQEVPPIGLTAPAER
jgi:hypothetical protein